MNYHSKLDALKISQIFNLYFFTLTRLSRKCQRIALRDLMAYGRKFIFFSFSVLVLSSCSLMPWHHSTTLDISLNFDPDANNNHALTMLIVQPVEQKDFVPESYESIAQKSLDKGVQRFVFLKGEKEQNMTLTIDDVPLAIYFILQHQPISGWKYLIAKPQGRKLSFSVGKDNVTQG